MRLFLPALTLLALAGCTAAPKPRPAPPAAPVVVPLPAPVPLGSDWRDWPLTPGDWFYRQDARGSVALFGAAGAPAAVSLRCDLAARSVRLSVLRNAPMPLTVRTSSTLRTLATVVAQADAGAPVYIVSDLAVSDPILDAMGFSRGRFVIEQAGAAPLVIPAYPEILRVTEDCRG